TGSTYRGLAASECTRLWSLHGMPSAHAGASPFCANRTTTRRYTLVGGMSALVAASADRCEHRVDACALHVRRLDRERLRDVAGDGTHTHADARQVHRAECLRIELVGGEVGILDAEHALRGAFGEDLRELAKAGSHVLAETNPDGV